MWGWNFLLILTRDVNTAAFTAMPGIHMNIGAMVPGLDFEQKILVKRNAVELLEQKLRSKSWKAAPIILSGNTDCYQPVERKLEITRKLLQVFLKYKHPVGIITKNALIQRDVDILEELAKDNLVRVNLSITSLDEKIRQLLEPRTASYKEETGNDRNAIIQKIFR